MTTESRLPDATGLIKAAEQMRCRCGHHASDHSKEWSRMFPRYCLHYDDDTMEMCGCFGFDGTCPQCNQPWQNGKHEIEQRICHLAEAYAADMEG